MKRIPAAVMSVAVATVFAAPGAAMAQLAGGGKVIRIVVQARGEGGVEDLAHTDFFPQNVAWGDKERRSVLSDLHEAGCEQHDDDAMFLSALKQILQGLSL